MVDASQTVTGLLSQWVACGSLTYKFSVTAVACGRDGKPCMLATFSKPTPQTPAAEAVARLCFYLSPDSQRVCGFTAEHDLHYYDLEIVKFDEAVLDRIVRRKMQLRATRLVDLSDDFVSTRVPAVICIRKEEQRKLERDATEDYLLEQMQHRDVLNIGKIPLVVFRETLDSLKPNFFAVPREVLLALVTIDQEDMVAYGECLSVAADMIDVMVGVDDNLDGDTTLHLTDGEALEAFEVVSARQTHYTVEKMTALIEAHLQKSVSGANAMTSRQAAAELRLRQESTTVILEENNSSEDKDVEAISGPASSFDDSLCDGMENSRWTISVGSSPPPAKKVARLTRHQLHSILATPQLLFSDAEINLIVALAETKTNAIGSGEVLCEELVPLVHRVRRIIFCYQRKCFVDRIDKYLLHQLQDFEKRNLEGTSGHLKKRLRQKQMKMAVKGMQKLLLSPFQTMQLIALTEERPGEPDHVINYSTIIPRMTQQLHELVDPMSLHDVAAVDNDTLDLPCEETVREASYSAFAHFDKTRSGDISIKDFYAALEKVGHTQDFPVRADTKQFGALADLSSGRVDYGLFQHLMYPLMLHYHQKRGLAVR